MADGDAPIVLVCGGTGRTGMRVVAALFAQGYIVRVLARNAEKASKVLGPIAKLQRGRLEIANTDLTNRHEVAQAVQGVDFIIIAVGAEKLTSPLEALGVAGPSGNHPKFVEFNAVETICTAAKAKKRVKKIVYMTGLAVGNPNSFAAMALGSVLSFAPHYKCLAENVVRACDIPYVIVRPGALSESPEPAGVKATLSQTQVAGSPDFMKIQGISRSSVAKMMVHVLRDDTVKNASFECYGSKTETREIEMLFDKIQPEPKNAVSTAQNHAHLHLRNSRVFFFVVLTVLAFILVKLVGFILRKLF
jgi:uncharacterized protein YbjT (DUF2867 family)